MTKQGSSSSLSAISTYALLRNGQLLIVHTTEQKKRQIVLVWDKEDRATSVHICGSQEVLGRGHSTKKSSACLSSGASGDASSVCYASRFRIRWNYFSSWWVSTKDTKRNTLLIGIIDLLILPRTSQEAIGVGYSSFDDRHISCMHARCEALRNYRCSITANRPGKRWITWN